ncbi:MAG TPA: polysaccharide deacetylase family protein [Chthonomonadaceae bacterium]|nr:polysaccharide deacetylase family protein [Chthonomonadaceae bacterium]
MSLGLLAALSGCQGGHKEAMPRFPPQVSARNSPRSAPPDPTNAPLAQWKPSPVQFYEGQSAPPRVALTFDAGSDAKAVPIILKILAEHKAHATFFLTGKFCATFPQECQAIAAAGMELGNHSYSHPHFTRLSDAEIRSQLERAEAAIIKACGRGAKPLFRFPYGDSDRRTRAVVAQAGYQPIAWTLDSLDSVGQPKSAAFVAERICRKVKPGYITLMHVSCVGSAEALPRIFEYLDKIGAQVVPVSELLLSQPPTLPIKAARGR